MSDSHAEFDRLSDLLVALHNDVEPGKMMSHPALTCKGKVFAFSATDGMGFRLGPDTDASAHGVKNPGPLSPFKTKPPLKGWWIVDTAEADTWETLAGKALAFTRTL